MSTDTDALVPASDPLQKFRGVQAFLESCWRQANVNIGVDRDDVAIAIRTLQSGLDEAADTIERLARERDEAVARERERCVAVCNRLADEAELCGGRARASFYRTAALAILEADAARQEPKA